LAISEDVIRSLNFLPLISLTINFSLYDYIELTIIVMCLFLARHSIDLSS
jgi:hypothetical protein